METTEQKVSRLHERVEAAFRLILRHADRHGGGGPDPTKVTTSAHPRLHSMTEALDHSGSISSTQHGTISTGNLHPEYTDATELATAVSDHAGASDPHTGYQKESEKDAASGYAALDASSLVIKKPADCSYTAGAGKIPLGNAVTGKLHAGWIQEVIAYADLTDDPYADHNARHEPGGSDPMAVDAAAATGSLRTIGTAATAACAGNDARLSDARTPTAHKDSHDPNDGSDPLDTAAPANIDGVQAAGVGTAHTFARADHAHRIQHAIADNALLTVDQADAADNDFAKFTASGLEGRSYQEAKADLGLPLYREVTITIPAPVDGDDWVIRTFKEAITLYDVTSTIQGAGTSVVFNLYHGTDLSAAGTKALTSDVTENSKTAGTTTGGASWADATVDAGAHLRVKIGTVTGAITQITLTIRYYLS